MIEALSSDKVMLLVDVRILPITPERSSRGECPPAPLGRSGLSKRIKDKIQGEIHI